MGIEIPSEYGGSDASFTTAIIAIEELAKVDPSVSVMADVHVRHIVESIYLTVEYFGEHRHSKMGFQTPKGQIPSSIGHGETWLFLPV
jgi:alkylation response protein AidB-like acyl-CoA dehydrogenase